MISPALMGGLVKEAGQEWVKVHLHGRLGVITVPRPLVLTEEELLPGREVQFYFSYLEVDDVPRDYDLSELNMLREVMPVPVGGVLTEVNDTAVKCEMPGGMGTVAPNPYYTPDVAERCRKEIFEPTMAAMAAAPV